MMAVTLTVGGDVHQLRFVSLRRERSHEAFGKVFAAGKQPFKGDGAGKRSVVKKTRPFPPRRAGPPNGRAWGGSGPPRHPSTPARRCAAPAPPGGAREW